MKRLLALIALLGLIAGMVTGCSDQGGGDKTTSTNPPTATPPGTNQ